MNDSRKRRKEKHERLNLLVPLDYDNPAGTYMAGLGMISHTENWLACQSDDAPIQRRLEIYKKVRNPRYQTLDEMRAEQQKVFNEGFLENRRARQLHLKEKVYG